MIGLYPDYDKPDMMSDSMALSESDDEDTEVQSFFKWEDNSLQSQVLAGLNEMRKNKHFCDVILQIGKQDMFAHRAVLAASSPYLMDLFNHEDEQPTRKEVEASNGIVFQLNGGFRKDALEKLIEYAYTARLDIPAHQVKSVYIAAVRLRMDRAARQCAAFLSSTIDLRSCLELRALPGVARLTDLVKSVDDFIDANVASLVNSQPLMALDRVCVEILHASKEELDLAQARSVCQLVLDWIHNQWLEDEKLTLEALKGKKHLLFLGKDNRMQDCDAIEEGSANDSEIIQDYKKLVSQQTPKQTTAKVRRHSAMKPAKPRELLYSRHINQEDMKMEDHLEDWKVITCTTLEGLSILGLITIDGHLFTCSIIQRLNRPASPPTSFLFSSLPRSASENGLTIKSKSPSLSRPPSQEKDLFTPVALMSQSKCAGIGCLDGKLIVCGGFDRGECLNNVSSYDPSTNEWTELEPMLEKRGRFDVAVCGGSLYAVAGSSGQMETSTAEKYDASAKRWSAIASLPAPISNIGLCSLDGTVYCIGGTFGQSGNKHCYRLVNQESKWERIGSLHVGRSQAAVTSFQGKLWVVGGCDAWNPLSSVEIFDPATNSWKFGPPMNTARRGCGLVEKNGLLYVIGGSDGTQTLCTTEIYDPRINLWTAGPNLTTCRVNVSTTVVGDKIWAVGGFSGKVFLNTMEYLDPHREEWTTYITTFDEEEEEEKKKKEEENKSHSKDRGLIFKVSKLDIKSLSADEAGSKSEEEEGSNEVFENCESETNGTGAKGISCAD